MPRANRYFTTGRNYHVTHRCHDRSFLLERVSDRDAYRKLLLEKLPEYPVQLFGYCITSNHVHLLLQTESAEGVSALMQRVQGEFAQAYNRKKKRSGAFWGDRYHATLVDGDQYLMRCLRYIDLNMVRAGVVKHPRDWPWCGYDELAGIRKRYRLINRDGLLKSFWTPRSFPEFSKAYQAGIDELLAKNVAQDREPAWTESLAVGRSSFLSQVEATTKTKRRCTLEQQSDDLWVLCEPSDAGISYRLKTT
jgi:putative transposase